MSHFAKVSDGIVVQVIVAEQDFIDTFTDKDRWIQTSFNTIGGQHTNGGTPLRKNFAGVGYTYDSERDAFIPPKPYDSWTLNEETCQWDSPVARPDALETQVYRWDEEAQEWFLKFEFVDDHWEDRAPDRQVVAQNTPQQIVLPEPVVVQEVVLPVESLSTEQVEAFVTDAIQALTTDQVSALSVVELGTASVSLSSAGTTDSIIIELSNNGGNDGVI